MALKLAHEDPSTGQTNPGAYFRVDYVLIRGPREGAWIYLHQYASEAARKADKERLPGPAVEFWVRNWVDQVPREVPVPDPPEGEERDTRAAPTIVYDQVPHNDYDAYFGDDVFLAGGTTPTKQAYLYVMAQPEWAEAMAA